MVGLVHAGGAALHIKFATRCLFLFPSIQRPGSDESLQPIGCSSVCVVSAVIAGYTYPHHTTTTTTTPLHGRLFFLFFFSFSFFFKQSFRKSRCGKSYRARENDYLLHLTRPYWKKTKKLFSCRDFFLKKRGERPKRETKKGQRLAAIFIFASFFLVYRLGAAVSLPWYIAAERDKSMGFMNPLTSYSLF